MSLEDEMRKEITRIGNELFYIDSKLEIMEAERKELEKRKLHLLQDLRILKLSLGMEVDEKEYQTSLYRLVRKR